MTELHFNRFSLLPLFVLTEVPIQRSLLRNCGFVRDNAGNEKKSPLFKNSATLSIHPHSSPLFSSTIHKAVTQKYLRLDGIFYS